MALIPSALLRAGTQQLTKGIRFKKLVKEAVGSMHILPYPVFLGERVLLKVCQSKQFLKLWIQGPYNNIKDVKMDSFSRPLTIIAFIKYPVTFYSSLLKVWIKPWLNFYVISADTKSTPC